MGLILVAFLMLSAVAVTASEENSMPGSSDMSRIFSAETLTAIPSCYYHPASGFCPPYFQPPCAPAYLPPGFYECWPEGCASCREEGFPISERYEGRASPDTVVTEPVRIPVPLPSEPIRIDPLLERAITVPQPGERPKEAVKLSPSAPGREKPPARAPMWPPMDLPSELVGEPMPLIQPKLSEPIGTEPGGQAEPPQSEAPVEGSETSGSSTPEQPSLDLPHLDLPGYHGDLLNAPRTPWNRSGVRVNPLEIGLPTTGDSVSTMEFENVWSDGSSGANLFDLLSTPDRSLVYFIEPAEVEGTISLALAPPGEPSRLWLYIKCIGFAKELVSGEERGGSFAGSALSFEEVVVGGSVFAGMGERIGDQPVDLDVGGTIRSTDIVYLTAAPEMAVGYAGALFWVDREAQLALKAEYYSEIGALVRTMDVEALGMFEGTLVTDEIYVQNEIDGSSTRIRFLDRHHPDGGLPEEIFDPETLSDFDPAAIWDGCTYWDRTFGGSESDAGKSVVQTSDGGYALLGYTESSGAGSSDAWLIKTDAQGNLEWDRAFGGSGWDEGISVVQTPDGGYALLGYTWSYGPGSGDAWLIKTDAQGSLEWDRTFGGSESDVGRSVVQTSDEGYALLGHTCSYGEWSGDAWLIKTDAQGNLQWNRTFGGSESDEGISVVQTSDGGYALLGYTYSSGAGSSDAWLIKTDAQGSLEWDRTFGGSESDVGRSVVQTSDGGYALLGYTYSYGDEWSSAAWLIKIDAQGNLEWDRTFGGSRLDEGSSVVQTSDGGYALLGYTYSSGAGSSDAWLIKTDAQGNLEWDRTFGGSDRDGGISVVQTSDGGYALLGDTESSGEGASDAWLIKYCPEE